MRRQHGSLGPIIQRRDRAISNYRDALRPASRLWFGGTNSRVIGTFMRKGHERPGTTFSNIQMLHLCLARTGFRASSLGVGVATDLRVGQQGKHAGAADKVAEDCRNERPGDQ